MARIASAFARACGPVLVLACVALAGCPNEDRGGRDESFTLRDAGADAPADDGGDGANAATDACEGERVGAPCGNRRHCVHGLCLPNACGDGIKAGQEECDDGNDVPGDGCEPLCIGEAGSCGNGHLDPDEQCDDGDAIDADGCSRLCEITAFCGDHQVDEDEECDDANDVADDACSNDCRSVVCGNGRRDPGEECDSDEACNDSCRRLGCGNGTVEGDEACDDGNDVDDDGCTGDCTVRECGNHRIEAGEDCDGEPFCTAGCRRSGDDPCRACEDAHCRNYLEFGFDLVAGCYDGTPPPDVSLEPGPSADFAAQCVAVTDCARRHRCALGEQGAAGCYCGSAAAERCIANGPAADAPCVGEWLAAARTDRNVIAVQRFSDWNYPAGLATFLLECDRASCSVECLGATSP